MSNETKGEPAMTMQNAPSLRWYQSRVLWAFLFGCAAGGILIGASEYMVLPKDRVTAANQIAPANSLAASYARHADDLGSQLATAQQATRDAQQAARDAQAALSQVKSQLELEKSAKPDRYKIVKEGWRTWRLDSATGTVCLLLASDADWKIPKIAAQGCDVQ